MKVAFGHCPTDWGPNLHISAITVKYNLFYCWNKCISHSQEEDVVSSGTEMKSSSLKKSTEYMQYIHHYLETGRQREGLNANTQQTIRKATRTGQYIIEGMLSIPLR